MADSQRTGIISKLYKIFLAPHQHAHQELRNREVVYNIVLLGTGLAVAILFSLLIIGFVALHNTYVLARVVVCGVALLYLAGVFWLSRTYNYHLSAYLLVFFYLVLATGTVWQWGINTPFGILLFGIVIVLASTLLSSKHALYTAALVGGLLGLMQIGEQLGVYTPDESWEQYGSSFGDALGYTVEFMILALVSWLFGRQMERSLIRAEDAESALLKEKEMLEIRVKERTLELRKAQMEEMQQMYQFAEMGQLSTALLHELANHLTVLTLEIEGLQSRKHADAIARATQIIGYLDKMVDSVRDQMRGEVREQVFNIASRTCEVMNIVRHKAINAKVTLDWEPPEERERYTCKGDPTRYSQVLAILVTNAIDAYSEVTDKRERRVMVRMTQKKSDIMITIADWGSGIPTEEREHLFRPASSAKKKGMGIGLFLARQMIETHFSGSIALKPAVNRTEFIILLPREEV